MAFYTPLLDHSSFDVVMMKATSSPETDGNWSNQDDSVELRTSEGIAKSLWSFEHNSDIYVVTQQETNGLVELNIFDPGTDTWTTKNKLVVAGDARSFNGNTNSGLANLYGVSVAVRSDGDVVVAALLNQAIVTDNNDGDLFWTGSDRGVHIFSDTGSGFVDRGGITAESVEAYSVVLTNPDSSDRINCAFDGVLGVFQTWSGVNAKPMGDVAANEKIAFSFTPEQTITVSSVDGLIQKLGSPTDDINVRFETDSSDLPSGSTVTNGTSNVIDGSTLSGSTELHTFTFSTPPTLTGGTKYWMIYERSTGVDASNRYFWAVSSPTTVREGGSSNFGGTVWTTEDTTEDGAMRIVDTDAKALYTLNISSTDVISDAFLVDAAIDDAHKLLAPGVIDSANEVYVPYIDVSNDISVAQFTSAADPTGDFTIHADVSDNTVEGNGRTALPFVVACLAVDGTDVYLIYADDTTQDMFIDMEVEDGGGVDCEHIDAVTVNRISMNNLTNSLGIVYLDGSTVKYSEIIHTAVLTALSQAEYPDQSFDVGPFEV